MMVNDGMALMIGTQGFKTCDGDFIGFLVNAMDDALMERHDQTDTIHVDGATNGDGESQSTISAGVDPLAVVDGLAALCAHHMVCSKWDHGQDVACRGSVQCVTQTERSPLWYLVAVIVASCVCSA